MGLKLSGALICRKGKELIKLKFSAVVSGWQLGSVNVIEVRMVKCFFRADAQRRIIDQKTLETKDRSKFTNSIFTTRRSNPASSNM